jgi:hypothetical protein
MVIDSAAFSPKLLAVSTWRLAFGRPADALAKC